MYRKLPKTTKPKAITRIKWGETKNYNKNMRRQKVGTGSRKEHGKMNSARWMNSVA